MEPRVWPQLETFGREPEGRSASAEALLRFELSREAREFLEVEVERELEGEEDRRALELLDELRRDEIVDDMHTLPFVPALIVHQEHLE